MTEQYYLVRLPLTDGQETDLHREGFYPNNFTIITEKVGIPIQPCADVETAATARRLSDGVQMDWNVRIAAHLKGDEAADLVFRTDMEAHIAVRDAEIARLRGALFAIASRQIGDSPAPSQAHIAQLEWDIEWCQRNARAAINEGAAG